MKKKEVAKELMSNNHKIKCTFSTNISSLYNHSNKLAQYLLYILVHSISVMEQWVS